MAMSSGSHASEIALNDAKNTENETEDDKNSLPPILPVTELDDEWNPMLEDYKDPNFNHYTSGPEKYKPASKVQAPWTNKSRPGMEEYGELYRVFINRIPFQINETGLESLCTKISCKPVKLYLRAKEYFMNTDKRTAWAIVEYAKHSDAEKLIIGLNRTPPLHLEAKFGLTDAEKEKLAKEKEEKRKFEEMSQASSRMSIEQMIEQSKTNPPNYKLLGIGRGLPVSPLYQQVSYTRKPDPGALILHGRPDLNLRPRHEPFNYSDEVDYFGQYAGGYNDDSMSVISNSMEEMQLRKPYVTPAGNRRQSYGGRGYNMANRRDNGRVPGNRHGGRGLHHNGFSSRNNFGPDDSPRPGTSKDEDGCASQVLATENGGYGSCINCKIVTVLMCSKCGARICGDVCHKQLQIHPHSCTPMGNGQVDRRWMQAVPTSTNRNPHQFAARNYHQQRGNKGAQSNNDKENYGDISQLNKLGLRQESQNKSDPPISVLELLGTAEKITCKVQNIVSVFGEPVSFVCYLHNQDLDGSEEQLLGLQEECLHAQGPISFQQGEMIAVKPEGATSWCRGVLDVKLEDQETWHVLGCDTGTSMQVTEFDMKPLSEEMKKIPRFTVHADVVDMTVTPGKLWEDHIKTGRDLRITNVLHIQGKEKSHIICSIVDDKGQLICIIELCDWLPLRPRYIPLCEPRILPQKCEVVLQTYCNSNLVYVSPIKDEDAVEEFNALHQALAYHCNVLCPAMKVLPEVGQMVGARSNIDGEYYRGVVIRVMSTDSVLVFFVDFGNKEEIQLGDMHLLPEDIAKVQCHAVLVCIQDVPNKPLNMASLNYLNKLVNQQVELMLHYNEKEDAVTLIELGSAVSVCAQLKTCLQGSWVKSLDVYSDLQTEDLMHNYRKGCETLDSLMETHLPVGERMRLVCLQWLGDQVISCCVATHPLLRYILLTLTKLIADYIEQCCVKMYVPCHLELCLAQFSRDLKWYRALATAISLNDCEVTFIDFCNVEVVPFSRIRKMPADFAEAPILATVTSLAGLKNSDFPNTNLSKRIVQLLGNNTTFEGIVLTEQTSDSNSLLYVPRIINTLINDKLIPTSRLDDIKTKLKLSENKPQDMIPEYLNTLQMLQPKSFEEMMKYHIKAPTCDLIDFDFEVSSMTGALPIVKEESVAKLDLLSSPISADTFDFNAEKFKPVTSDNGSGKSEDELSKVLAQKLKIQPEGKNQAKPKISEIIKLDTKKSSEPLGWSKVLCEEQNIIADVKSQIELLQETEKSKEEKPKKFKKRKVKILEPQIVSPNSEKSDNTEESEFTLESEDDLKRSSPSSTKAEVKKSNENWVKVLSEQIVLPPPSQLKPKKESSSKVEKTHRKSEKTPKLTEVKSKSPKLSAENQAGKSKVKSPIKEKKFEEIDEEAKLMQEMLAIQAKLAELQLKKKENPEVVNVEVLKKADEKIKTKKNETPEERKERKKKEKELKLKPKPDITTTEGESDHPEEKKESKRREKESKSKQKPDPTTAQAESGHLEEKKKSKRKEKELKLKQNLDLLTSTEGESDHPAEKKDSKRKEKELELKQNLDLITPQAEPDHAKEKKQKDKDSEKKRKKTEGGESSDQAEERKKQKKEHDPEKKKKEKYPEKKKKEKDPEKKKKERDPEKKKKEKDPEKKKKEKDPEKKKREKDPEKKKREKDPEKKGLEKKTEKVNGEAGLLSG